jgi:hypothetical protein
MQFHASTKYKYYSQDMSIEHLYLVSLFCLSRGILYISNGIGDFKYEIFGD